MREFAYGQQYAWMIMVFSVMVVFSISCPLVAPFGRCWAQMDRQTDRHRWTGRQAGRQTQTDRQQADIDRQRDRQTQTGRHRKTDTGRPAIRKLGSLTDRHGEQDRL